MPTPAPRPRGDGSMKERLREERKDREQQRRQRVIIPKAKPAAAGGSMQGFTRARPGSTTWDTGGAQARNWTFDTSVDSSPGAKPGLVMGGDQLHFGVAEAGYYSTHAQMQITLTSGTPGAVLFQANNASTDLAPFGEAWGHLHFDGRYRASFWCGPFWLDAGSFPLGLEAFISGSFTGGSVLSTFVDVWRVG